MKKSDLKNIIREEIYKLLKEEKIVPIDSLKDNPKVNEYEIHYFVTGGDDYWIKKKDSGESIKSVVDLKKFIKPMIKNKAVTKIYVTRVSWQMDYPDIRVS
jgi:hypothetical protein